MTEGSNSTSVVGEVGITVLRDSDNRLIHPQNGGECALEIVGRDAPSPASRTRRHTRASVGRAVANLPTIEKPERVAASMCTGQSSLIHAADRNPPPEVDREGDLSRALAFPFEHDLGTDTVHMFSRGIDVVRRMSAWRRCRLAALKRRD